MTEPEPGDARRARTLTAESIALPARVEVAVRAPMESQCDLVDEHGRIVGHASLDGVIVTATIADETLAGYLRAGGQRISLGYQVIVKATPVVEAETIRIRPPVLR